MTDWINEFLDEFGGSRPNMERAKWAANVKRKCAATTKAGKPCGGLAMFVHEDHVFCKAHYEQQIGKHFRRYR